MIFQHSKAQTILLRAKAIPIRATTQHKVEHPLRPAPGLERREQFARVAPCDPRSSSRYLALDERHYAEVIKQAKIGIRPLPGEYTR